ncbi:MAG: hypothetical protein UDB11_00515 [Peptococcaceae bacterium]|nr:hypothetical protein [Peptococcaceae bacterium]
MKELTKALVNAYNEASSVEEARALRQRLFSTLVGEYGAPHFAITFSQTDFIADGQAKVIKIQAEKNGVIEVYEMGDDLDGQ